MYSSDLTTTDARTHALAELGARRLGVAGRRALSREGRARRDADARTRARTAGSRRARAERVLGRARERRHPEAASGIAPAPCWRRESPPRGAAATARSELRGTIELQWQRSYTEPSRAATEDREVAERVIPGPRGRRRSAGARKGVVAAQRVTRNRLSLGRTSRRAGAGDRARTPRRRRGPAARPRRALCAGAALRADARAGRDSALYRAARGAPGAPDLRGRARDHARRPPRDGGQLCRGPQALRGLDCRLRGVRAPFPAGRQIDRRRPDRDPGRRPRRGGARTAHGGIRCSRRWASTACDRPSPAFSPTCCHSGPTTARRSTSSRSQRRRPHRGRRRATGAVAARGGPNNRPSWRPWAVRWPWPGRRSNRRTRPTSSDLRAGTQLVLAAALREASSADEGTSALNEARWLFQQKGNAAALRVEALTSRPVGASFPAPGSVRSRP